MVTVTAAPLGLAVSRALGTVVVTVHGDLDVAGATQLGSVLADLIDGQGNLSVVVDLHDANDAGTSMFAVSVFAGASERSRGRGGAMSLSDPPGQLHQALQLTALDGLVRTTPDGRSPARSAQPSRPVHPKEMAAHPAGGPRSHVHPKRSLT